MDPVKRSEPSGIALLMVLWILAVLMVTVLSFATMTRTETLAAISRREGVAGKFLAEAAVQRVIAELIYRKTLAGTQPVDDDQPWKTDGTPYTVSLGSGSFTVSILSEAGKVDINTTPELILRNIFANLGLPMETVDTVVDSMADWRDADDLVRLHGAENDYYQSLASPYKPANADFQTLEELLRVKGITPQVLYGDGKTKGIIDLLTVHSKTQAINPNAAPREVLMALPGMTREAVDAILALREVRDITVQELPGIVGPTYSLMAPYLATAAAGAFSVVATGRAGPGAPGYSLRATVMIDNDNKVRYLYYKAPLEIRNDGNTQH